MQDLGCIYLTFIFTNHELGKGRETLKKVEKLLKIMKACF